ncbi:MAG: hypothetical protein KatS3mg007_2208 [Thermoanaerobaculum sp.]|nr:MAG: hypothetical protein KatS3mg007_2208 [Thermoanaerobaculum sp.]
MTIKTSTSPGLSAFGFKFPGCGALAKLMLLLVVVSAPSAYGEEPARLVRDGDSLRFSGASPSGKVAGVAAWVDVHGLLAYVNVKQEQVLASGIGEAVWKPGERLPDEGFYLMADPMLGRFALLGWPVDVIGVGRGVAEVMNSGRELLVEAFQVVPTDLVTVLIRPGRGVWALASPDGSKFDHDGQANAQQVLFASDFTLVSGEGVLETFEAGDHVVIAELRSGTVVQTVLSRR